MLDAAPRVRLHSRAMTKSRIGVIGSGVVGKALGEGLAKAGHAVKVGTREPSKLAEWAKQAGANASVGSFEEAAQFGEVIIVATKWADQATESALKLAGLGHFDGKPVMDTTNPLAFGPTGPFLTVGHTDSAGEQVQRWLPKAHVVKAFNIVGSVHMVNPSFPDGKPDMLIAGNDANAKKVVSALCEELGWPTVDMGGIEASRYLEPFAMVWILHYVRTQSGNHAFKLLKK